MAITIEITNSQIVMGVEEEGKGRVLKIIDPDDFASAMARQGKVETGLLPSNTRYFSTNGQLTSVLLEIKPHVRRLDILGTLMDVPLPGCLMLIVTTNQPDGTKHVSQSYLCCYSDLILTKTTPLYCFPYGNVHMGGNICWGSVATPKISELYQLGALPDVFLNTKFNGHLDGSTFNQFSKKVDGLDVTISRGCQLAQHLFDEKATTFPTELLRPAGRNLSDLIKVR